MVGSFAAVLYLGQTLNPQPTLVVVAARDLAPGDLLTVEDLAVAPMGLVDADPRVVSTFVTEDEVGNYLGATIVEPIYANQPILKGALGDVVGSVSMASQLEGEDVVAMVVPVTAETAPGDIRRGDFVDLTVSVLDAAAAPLEPFGEGGSQEPDRFGQLPSETDFPQPQALASPTQGLLVPLAKSIVSNALVLDIGRSTEVRTTIDSTGASTERVVEGPITSLVLQIPRDAVEVVQFALAAGTVRVTLLSSLVPANGTAPGARRPSLGMTWNDLVAMLEMEREQRLSEGLPGTLTGAGSALYAEATRAAGPQSEVDDPVPVPAVTVTPNGGPTPTPRP
jgi:Flp pilus assembly protein CpaB